MAPHHATVDNPELFVKGKKEGTGVRDVDDREQTTEERERMGRLKAWDGMMMRRTKRR